MRGTVALRALAVEESEVESVGSTTAELGEGPFLLPRLFAQDDDMDDEADDDYCGPFIRKKHTSHKIRLSCKAWKMCGNSSLQTIFEGMFSAEVADEFLPTTSTDWEGAGGALMHAPQDTLILRRMP